MLGLKVGQIVYVHTREMADERYVDKLVEFEIYKLDFDSIYLKATKDNSKTTVLRQDGLPTQDCEGHIQTLYETREHFYKDANDYNEKLKNITIYSKIIERIETFTPDEIKILEKLLKI